jgi:hypothetical protein
VEEEEAIDYGKITKKKKKKISTAQRTGEKKEIGGESLFFFLKLLFPSLENTK